MDLHYEVSGSGEPIVFIHSGGADSRQWKLVAPKLSPRGKVVTVDGRGCGQSPSPDVPPSYVEDVRALLDHLELDSVTLVGHSMGGQIATEFALAYPERVAGLVLIAPSLSGFPYSQEFVSYMESVSAAAPDIEKMIRLALQAPSYQVVMNSGHRELMIEMLRHHITRTFTWGTFDAIWPDPPAFERLEELKARTLFVIGEQELPDNLRVAEAFRRVPHIEFVHVPGADHMIPLTHPDELVREVLRFMEGA